MNRKATIQVLEWVKAVVIALVIALFLRSFVFEVVQVKGPSMQDTLHTGQRVYIEKLLFRLTGPRRGDIVECYFGEDREKTYIKRVIGMPGEELVILEGKIYINGYEYDDPWFDGNERTRNYLEGTWQIPQGEYFVMGDNRLDSKDSRNALVGCIERKNILGRGTAIIWPLNEFSVLD